MANDDLFLFPHVVSPFRDVFVFKDVIEMNMEVIVTKIISILAILLASNTVHAMTCSMSKEDGSAGGKSLFKAVPVLKGDTKYQVIMVKPDGTVLENLLPESVNTPEMWKAIDGSIFGEAARFDDGTYSVGSGQIDLAKNGYTFFSDAVTVGSAKSSLSLMTFPKGVSMTCSE